MNLVEFWVKKDKVRWAAGVIGGLVAGLLAIAAGYLLGLLSGGDPLTVIKFPAILIVGPSALDLTASSSALVAGLVVIEMLSAFLGFLYAHFTRASTLIGQIGMGFTWGAFGWIFLSNLYSASFWDLYAAKIPHSATFVYWMVFGQGLLSVSWVEKIIRPRR